MQIFGNLTPVFIYVAIVLFVGWAVAWIIWWKEQGVWEVIKTGAVLAITIEGAGFLMSLNLSRWQWAYTVVGVLVVWVIGYCLWKEHQSTPAPY
jgi:hypothetical protein